MNDQQPSPQQSKKIAMWTGGVIIFLLLAWFLPVVVLVFLFIAAVLFMAKWIFKAK